jgi:hypothetical protein
LILQAILNLARLFEVAMLYHLQPLTRYHAKAVMAFLLAVGAVWGLQQALGGAGGGMALGTVMAFWLLYFALLAMMGLAPEEKRILTRWQGRHVARP